MHNVTLCIVCIVTSAVSIARMLSVFIAATVESGSGIYIVKSADSPKVEEDHFVKTSAFNYAKKNKTQKVNKNVNANKNSNIKKNASWNKKK